MAILAQEATNTQNGTAEAVRFFEDLFGGAEAGYLSLWRKDTRASRHFPVPSDLADIAAWGVEQAGTTDVYFGLGLRSWDMGQNERGKAENVCAIPCLWLDCDVTGPGHKADNLPPDFDEALLFLLDLPLKPSYIIHSGGGLHAYWLFRELWTFSDDRERAKAQAVVRGWQAFIIGQARAKGWHVDNTSDLARVLRLPGTLNRKSDPPLLVHILTEDDVRYNPSDFDEYKAPEETRVTAPTVSETIPDGQRNSTLTSLAGTMRRRGMSTEAIYAALLQENAAKCRPPLAEDEVLAIAKSVGRYNPQDDAGSQKAPAFKDYAHALVLAPAFKGRYRWAEHRGRWMEYDGCVWRAVPPEKTAKVASDVLRQCYAAEMAATTDQDKSKNLAKFIMEASTFSKVENALAFLKGWPDILTLHDEWDKDPWTWNVLNGTLDLRTSTLRHHDPDDLLTKLAPVKYDPVSDNGTWRDHITLFMPNNNVRRQVQRDLGRALVGATLEEFLGMWYGQGANGKTTTTRAVMAVAGDYALRAAPDLLIASKNERHPTEVADLMGARLVFSVEVQAGKQLAEALVKDLTGGDKKKARFMRQDFFEFEQTYDLFLICNHKPGVQGTDNGIWRRIRLVPWEVTLPSKAQRPQEDVVAELVADGSAILNWLLDGLRDWQAEPKWIAPEVLTSTAQYRDEQDRLGGFLNDCCEVGPHFTVAVKELFGEYTQWAETSGEEALGKTKFGDLLKERGISQKKGAKGVRRWVGVRVANGGDCSG